MMRHRVLIFVSLLSGTASAQQCPPETLLEPYSGVCAVVIDRRDEFVPPPAAATQAREAAAETEQASTARVTVTSEPASTARVTVTSEPAPSGRVSLASEPPIPDGGFPVPGTMSAGTWFEVGRYPITTSSHLHTQMMVHPEGLADVTLPNWVYTTSTNRTHLSVEVVGMYRSSGTPKALLGLFAWPCFEEWPCPNGATSSGWQFYHALEALTCNVTQTVDQGGHAQKIVHYANHTDRLDDDDPPAWRNAIYLWNFCDDNWDLIWRHEYRQNKIDCSLTNACAWWGPVFELFGSVPYPEIPELGYERGLLIHDGIWSELRPAEGAGFIDPESRPALIPWQLSHLDPNRGFGAGNLFDANDAPSIAAQQPLATLEDTALDVAVEDLVIADPDVVPDYHAAFALTLYGGDSYSRDELTITPDPDFAGTLRVPATVSDGAADSDVFEIEIVVTPVNDPPAITGQVTLRTRERTALTIGLGDLIVADPDNDPSELVLAIADGPDYTRTDNTVTPRVAVTGSMTVTANVTDGELSDTFALVVDVEPDVVPPEIVLVGEPAIEIFVGDRYVDAGATAFDDLDGDLTAAIATDAGVDTSVAGTYYVVYSVADLAGNAAEPVTRTIVVRPRSATVAGGDGGGCFIATAAYGSYLDPHVVTLRSFRDEVLARHELGRWLIAKYYRHSPPIAAAIERNESLRRLTRLALTPVVLAVAYPAESGVFLTLFGIAVLRRRGRACRAAQQRFP